jgi:ubiquinone/menaquinone biosynthesis C-methylase UbiE
MLGGMADSTGTDWRQAFEETYAGSPSKVMERVWRSVLGDEYPDGLDPYSYITRTDLHRMADELRVGPGRTLADVGCGRGGAGLWVASKTGARLIGIDIAEAPLVAARDRARAMGADATFQRGEFEATGLDDGAVDAVMSVDALLFTPDKQRAFVELRRILRPGGRLVLTSWDYHGQPANRPPQVPDHRPLLEPAGFRLVAYEETPVWRENQERMHAGLLDAIEEVAAEDGESVESARAGLAEMHATMAFMTRRFLLVAEVA